ncbi:hypothetical protein [Kitasatospora sp. NPDC059599]|uniref:hypothetical protein n=1 Tax=Kitasatospora sp. NPDC059599 TaxID=3346880 RepID=UPI0036B71455
MLALAPPEVLIAREAAGADRRAWEQCARPVPAGRLFARAAGDAGIGRAQALAALGLAAGVRADVDAARRG